MKIILFLLAGLGVISSFGFGQYHGGMGDGYSSSTSEVGWASHNTSKLLASSDTITANGVSTVVITVQLKDEDENSITYGGENVVLSTTAGVLLSSVIDNDDGIYTQTLKSGTTAATVFITAMLNGFDLTDTMKVVFSPPTPPLSPVTLGMTKGFVILSYAGITNTGPTVITGNVGTSPIQGAGMSGFGSPNVTGTIYAVDASGPAGSIPYPEMLTVAMGDLTIAYNDAAGRSVDPISVSGNIGGQTLYPGLYKSIGSLEVTAGDVTLDAQGDSNAVWIFQIASNLNMTSDRQVILSGGAKASNIFWQVGSAATFGTTCVMKGTIMAQTAITFATGASLEGRALAKTESVTLQSNTVGGTTDSPIHASIYLGTAANFRIFSGAGVTINNTAVAGDVGVSPGISFTNNGGTFGTLHLNDGPAIQAKIDFDTAYNDARRQIDSTLSNTELGSRTLTTGVYKSAAGNFSINSDTLTLSGNVNAVFLFKMSGTLTAASGTVVFLTGGALPSNVFWQVGNSAIIDGDFKGIILADSSITQNGDSINGRAFARNKFVTLNGNVLLPVELVSFTASAHQKNVDLTWSTATEVNNFGFAVERKTNNNWNKIGFVDGGGTTNSPKNYSFTDNNLSAGKYSYRLKQIDRNGAFNYSKSVEVTIVNTPNDYALLQNYPNPFNPSTIIQYSIVNAGMVSLKVYDLLGKEVAILVNGNQEAGSYSMPFNPDNRKQKLSGGVYFYRLESGSFVSTKKFVLLK